MVRERGALHGALKAGGIAFAEHIGQTVIAPAVAFGATIVFEGPDFSG